MIWPERIERAIQGIEEAPFLTAAQKRDIFYNNAVRFLRLSDAAHRECITAVEPSSLLRSEPGN